MTDELRTLAPDDPFPDKPTSPFKVDLSVWKMDKYIEWQEAANAGSMVKLCAMAKDVVVDWPYPYAVGEWSKMEPREWRAMVQAVTEAIVEAFLKP